MSLFPVSQKRWSMCVKANTFYYFSSCSILLSLCIWLFSNKDCKCSWFPAGVQVAFVTSVYHVLAAKCFLRPLSHVHLGSSTQAMTDRRWQINTATAWPLGCKNRCVFGMAPRRPSAELNAVAHKVTFYKLHSLPRLTSLSLQVLLGIGSQIHQDPSNS